MSQPSKESWVSPSLTVEIPCAGIRQRFPGFGHMHYSDMVIFGSFFFWLLVSSRA